MKVIGFSGSPRKGGNTEILVKEILRGASESGAQTQFYRLDEMQINGCKSCHFCRKTFACAQKDDMQKLYAEIQESDYIVIGSPVYMWQMSGQAKIFNDRFLMFMNPDFTTRNTRGTKTVLAFTQGNEDVKNFEPYFDLTARNYGFLGFPVVDKIVAGGTGLAGDILKQPELLKQAHGIGRSITGKK